MKSSLRVHLGLQKPVSEITDTGFFVRRYHKSMVKRKIYFGFAGK